MKKWLITSIASLAAFALTGCNTIDGFGQDLENTGDRIEDAAD